MSLYRSLIVFFFFFSKYRILIAKIPNFQIATVKRKKKKKNPNYSFTLVITTCYARTGKSISSLGFRQILTSSPQSQEASSVYENGGAWKWRKCKRRRTHSWTRSTSTSSCSTQTPSPVRTSLSRRFTFR